MTENNERITETSEHIHVQGYRGTWYVIDTYYNEQEDCELFLLEHETYGDMTECLIVDEDCNVILDDVWNGFEDYEEYKEYNNEQ